MDLLCVADLGAWSLTKLTFLPPDAVSRMHQLGYDMPRGSQYARGIAWTSYFTRATDPADHEGAFTPIGSLIASLSRKLAWGNPALRELAEYYPKTGIEGQGGGSVRFWSPPSIYSDKVCAQLSAGMRQGPWDEWSNFFS